MSVATETIAIRALLADLLAKMKMLQARSPNLLVSSSDGDETPEEFRDIQVPTVWENAVFWPAIEFHRYEAAWDKAVHLTAFPERGFALAVGMRKGIPRLEAMIDKLDQIIVSESLPDRLIKVVPTAIVRSGGVPWWLWAAGGALTLGLAGVITAAVIKHRKKKQQKTTRTTSTAA